jgi:integrase
MSANRTTLSTSRLCHSAPRRWNVSQRDWRFSWAPKFRLSWGLCEGKPENVAASCGLRFERSAMKLAYAVDLYISRRQSSSERFCGPAGTLRSFSRRFDGLFLHRITPSQVLQFLNCPHTERATWKIKYGVLRMFFEYWHLRGNLKTVPLPPSGPKVTRTFVPYIYSLSDLRALIDALPQCQRNRACAMSTNTFRTLLLFLYGTGMRIGEAVGLHIS